MRRSLTRLDLLVIGVALPRPCRCPWGKTISAPGTLVCLGLMLSMPAASWWRLGLWLLVGLAVYGFYGWRAGRFKEVGLMK